MNSADLRRAFRLPRLALAIAACLAPLAAHAGERIDVLVDEAKIIELPEGTTTVILGNPIVADLTLLRGNNKVVVTGKGFGQTNLLALDLSGNTLGESVIHVKSGFKGLTLMRGTDRETYSCEPRCLPTVDLTDNAKFMGDTGSQIQAHTGLAAGSLGSGGSK